METMSLALIKIIARLRPQIWEIVGGGPQGLRVGAVQHAMQTAPTEILRSQVQQTDFYRGGDPQEAWLLNAQLSAVDLSRRLADAAAVIYSQGGDPAGFLRSTAEEMRVDGQPPELRLPAKWWSLWKEPPPRPNERDLASVLATIGVTLATLGDQVKDEVLSKAFTQTGLHIVDKAAESGGRHGNTPR